jgi:hypothetical protein
MPGAMPGFGHCHNPVAFTLHHTMSLLEIANKVIANDEIGSVPVYGADAQWFVNQFQEVISLHPEAKAWDEDKIYTAMCFLYLMDPEDFVS